jgi:hypothetical protein
VSAIAVVVVVIAAAAAAAVCIFLTQKTGASRYRVFHGDSRIYDPIWYIDVLACRVFFLSFLFA